MRRIERQDHRSPGSGQGSTLREITQKVSRAELNEALRRKAELDAQKTGSSERTPLSAEPSKTNS